MVELTRRNRLATAAAASAMALVALGGPAQSSGAESPTEAWNHDPASSIGPGAWGQIGFPTCSQGTRQSPVNLVAGAAAAVGGPPLLMRYQESEIDVENTGHVVEVPIPADVHNTLQIGGDRYELTQYHFHAPSEHAIDGVRADVEAHFVHVSASGATAVVGVLYRMGGEPNETLDRILRSAPATAGEEEPAGDASPAELFDGIQGIRLKHAGPMGVRSFYAYAGSLTTPGCTEGVRWSVLVEGGHVSPAAVAHLHQVIAQFPDYGGYPNNNRPVQPLNGRVVELRRGR